MSDNLEQVRDYYRAIGLTERLKATLAAFGPEETRFSPQQLAGLDQFHTRGLAATAELAKLMRISAEDLALDIGSGVGGPARFVAATCGCKVIGVDFSEPFVEASRYLTDRTRQAAQVRFEVASALALPFTNGEFDVALLLHVAMNIADRAGLYREIRRVLKLGARFGAFDIVSTGREPIFPLPWARTPAASFLLTAAETRTAIEAAGFRVTEWRDESEAAKAWITELRTSGAPPAVNLVTVMGPDFAEAAANLGRNYLEGRLGLVAAVFEAAPVTA
jgi:sarcosine/dimethylglycine N-methyltransferase